jgi:hypothetical protein
MSNARFTNLAHSDTVISIILDEVLKDYDATSMLQYLPVLTLIKCGMFSTAIEYLKGLSTDDEKLAEDRDVIVGILEKYDAFKAEEEE